MTAKCGTQDCWSSIYDYDLFIRTVAFAKVGQIEIITWTNSRSGKQMFGVDWKHIYPDHTLKHMQFLILMQLNIPAMIVQDGKYI